MKIITDTSTLYSPEEGKTLDITVLPLQVSLNGQTYQEFVEIDAPTFLKLLQEKGIPSSSQPPIGQTMEALDACKDEDTLVICMADGLSGTYQSTLALKNSLDVHDHIEVFNSTTLCGPQRYLLQKAIMLREEKKSLHEIVNALKECLKGHRSFLIPSDFDFLKRGGRLTPLAATIGGMLKIVPVMTQTEDGRRLEKFTIKRTYKSAIDEIIHCFKEMKIDQEYIIYVSHADALKKATSIMNQLKEAFHDVTIELLELSPAFITQGGPGCIAIQSIKKS